jgi:hypothetical protein
MTENNNHLGRFENLQIHRFHLQTNYIRRFWMGELKTHVFMKLL